MAPNFVQNYIRSCRFSKSQETLKKENFSRK